MVDAATKSDVLRVHDAFYDTVRAGDFSQLDALLSTRRPVAVFHPGWTGITGREDVLASWAEIFVTGRAPDVWPVEEQIFMTPGMAMVYCTEILGERRLTATNVFVREDDEWRMTQRMAVPVTA